MCGVVVELFVDFQFPPAGRAPVPVRLFVGARDQVFRDTTMVGDPMVRVGHLFILFFWKQVGEKKQTSEKKNKKKKRQNNFNGPMPTVEHRRPKD